MRLSGKITAWNEHKGFGFIRPDAGGKQLFVHIRAFSQRNKTPALNQSVSYTLSSDKQGRPCADKVAVAGVIRAEKTQKGNQSFAVLLPLLFLASVGVSVLLNKIEFMLLLFYVVLSLFTFMLYALDKSAAQNGSWRTQERTLHLIALAGGWPGAMIAQQTLRHKSQKKAFRVVFWITVLLNTSVLIGWHTTTGSTALHTIIQRVL